ncbi:uncharacterized protein BDZ99DRAFT_533159 [Mytilinidion resinicola]|uniref:GET complex, subunit GET2 n=1 Tax=Mytilinidion resinicola TaxID=574789 RepID=A0A6A6YLT0_9PEZI|nr:uncharacterized protein BDZ99DRAFT_533159 [Mytilinidion resinicola]KAF2808935.1 hypothetical protein BDZ99DRAFT_533159 [Mytilinidion resinicola]
MESPTPTPGASAAKLTPSQEQARLRRERRDAKIKAGGASRLQAISSLNGGRAPPGPPPAQAAATPPSRPQPASVHDDPAEVDISQHYYTPQTQPRLPPSRSNQPNPFAFNGTEVPPFPPPGGNPNDDPMMAMLQQMMGGAGDGDPNSPQIPPGMPPGLAQMLGGMGQGEPAPPASSSAHLWRIVHALFSLGLALYITVTTSFTGSKLARTQRVGSDSWADDEGASAATLTHFFYAFATFEVVMQSSRYFLERGRLPPSGLLGGVAQILPEPYAGYVRVVGRYSVIWRTVVADAMVVVFVLGASAWWRGGVVS